jgi:hypothetical protein
MKRSTLILLAGALLGTGTPSRAGPAPQSILSYHGHPDRNGNFVVAGLTWDRARSLRLDKDFRPRIAGHVYAQPLYWRAPGSSAAILLLEDKVVYPIDAGTGNEVWKRSLGKSVARSSLTFAGLHYPGPTADGSSSSDEPINLALERKTSEALPKKNRNLCIGSANQDRNRCNARRIDAHMWGE